MTPTSRLTIDQILTPLGSRQMDDDAADMDLLRRVVRALSVAAALYFGLSALGVERATTLVAVPMAIAAFSHCQLIVENRRTRDRIIVAMRRYWRLDLSEANLPALELHLAHVRRAYDRFALLETIVLPAFCLMVITANGLQSAGISRVPGWAIMSATCLFAIAIGGLIRYWDFQIRDRLERRLCVRPT